MSDMEAANPMAPDPAGQDNISRAHVTGKVPQIPRLRKRRGKAVKLSAQQKSHAGRLSRRGLISPRAAAATGIKANPK